jgi:hypothetical protein
MAVRISVGTWIGLTPRLSAALDSASEFHGMTPSQYGRQAILEKLAKDGFSPAAKEAGKSQGQPDGPEAA